MHSGIASNSMIMSECGLKIPLVIGIEVSLPITLGILSPKLHSKPGHLYFFLKLHLIMHAGMLAFGIEHNSLALS